MQSLKLKELLEAESDGRFKVEIYPNGQLGGDRQATESVSLGKMCIRDRDRAYRTRRNKMTITITWQGALLTAIAVLGIILLIYLIVLISNLIKTVKNANKVLEDAQVISAIAADKAKKIDGIVDGISAVSYTHLVVLGYHFLKKLVEQLYKK